MEQDPTVSHIQYKLSDPLALIEQLLHLHLTLPMVGTLRRPFSFITKKGTEIFISIQTGYSYGSTPNANHFDLYSYKDVEVYSQSCKFSKEFVETYAEYPDSYPETSYKYVPIVALAEEILKATKRY